MKKEKKDVKKVNKKRNVQTQKNITETTWFNEILVGTSLVARDF